LVNLLVQLPAECQYLCHLLRPLLAQDMPPMREGGKRLVVAPPGPMQRQGVKSLTWVTGLIQAVDEAGGGLLLMQGTVVLEHSWHMLLQEEL
jgi:hypothetical protein